MNRDQHILYTRNELTSHPYYIKIIELLKNEGITSYIDIGANVGEYCNVLFDYIPTLNNSILIEPDKENFDFLCGNVKNKNSEFLHLGIGYNLKNPFLLKDPNNVGGFKVIETDNSESNFTIKTLEELNLPIVDLVKMDIEGGEYNLIENSTFIKGIKFLEIEFHNYWNISTIEYIKNHLPEYEIIIKDENNLGIARCLLKIKICQ
jgi:FkbM family methyltransferase